MMRPLIACYYPGDLDTSVDACARYEDACDATCDGSGDEDEADDEDEEDEEEDEDEAPDDCCSEFATHDDCAAHDAYADCVGETAERCQWIFLSSPKGGFCRVDPISKCLEVGNCVCNTEDFQGGGAGLGDGIVFLAPISVTPRDVAPDSLVTAYYEAAATPVDGTDELHPRDEAFFVSRVDFTAKTLTYELSASFPAESTVLFKLHHLYRDQWLEGDVYEGPSLAVHVDSSPSRRRTFVRGEAVDRDLDAEIAPDEADVTLGPFSGELFDVRVYAGALSADEVATVGALRRPGRPEDASRPRDGILRGGCDPDVDAVPSDDGIQTYGSGAFGTLWVAAAEYGTDWWTEDFDEVPPGTNGDFAADMFDELVVGDMYDLTEEMLDLDHYFQEQKMLSHVWERYYFETDMMAVNLAPWSWYASGSEVPGYSARDWNNPCRFLHQHNNGWLFPFYGSAIEKWEPTDDGELFDLKTFYYDRGHSGYGFVVHETFHGLMIETSFDAYNAGIWADNEDGGCPVACDTCEVDDCADSDSWTYGGDDDQDCAWVAEDADARCSLEGDGIFGSSTLEDLQTTVAVSGATGGSVAGPADSRPGPFGWNALKLDGFDAGDFVTITVAWDDLDTDDADANPADLNAVHALDGKDPESVTVEIGDAADVVHVLLVPTPPADYVDDEERVYDTFEPVPCYGYAYEVAVADAGSETASAAMAYGVLAYADAGDWFETRCTCTTLADDLSDCWAPQFAAADHPPTPTQEPTEGSEPADYDGYELYTWQLCPLSCGRCGDYEDPVCVSDSGCCCEPRGCFDDPLGIIADLGPAVGEACAGIADDGCDDFQADYNGYELYTWQLPRTPVR
ncbi:hypothetical protein JL721_7112 [Aureococcus anophagefferens]|nr:hypothetical protein JL721_7112 [Aureococcus anophagefferens]